MSQNLLYIMLIPSSNPLAREFLRFSLFHLVTFDL